MVILKNNVTQKNILFVKLLKYNHTFPDLLTLYWIKILIFLFIMETSFWKYMD